MALDDARGRILATEGRRAQDLVALFESSYAGMARIAAFRGASTEQVDDGICQAAASVLTAAGAHDPQDLRYRLFHELVVRVATLERAAGRSVAVEPEVHPEPAVASDRFEPANSPWADFFVNMPASFDDLRPDGARADRARATAEEALAELPLGNRIVVVLRDVARWSAEDVAALLGVDLERQRVALHAARARIRRALEGLAEDGDG